MSLNRSAILRSIIEYQLPIEPSVEQLRCLGWDTDQVYAVVTCEDVLQILERFLKAAITAKELNHWAELIECREDIDFQVGHEELLQSCIFRLANPDLWGEIKTATARDMQAKLPIDQSS